MRRLSKGLVTVRGTIWKFVVLALLAVPAPATARETYVAFARRLTTEVQEGTRFRADLEAVIAMKVNAYRRGQGAAALKTSSGLLMAARAQAMDLALHDDMGHRASTGQNFDSRMRALRGGELYLPSMGENAARERSKGVTDAGKAANLVQQWIKSSGHRRNMVSRSFVAVATGVVQKGNHIYAVQIFVGPEVKSNAKRAGGVSVY